MDYFGRIKGWGPATVDFEREEEYERHGGLSLLVLVLVLVNSVLSFRDLVVSIEGRCHVDKEVWR